MCVRMCVRLCERLGVKNYFFLLKYFCLMRKRAWLFVLMEFVFAWRVGGGREKVGFTILEGC